jgi:hypothetical protein
MADFFTLDATSIFAPSRVENQPSMVSSLKFHAGFKHGVNLLPEDERTGKGRVSIILWGQADVIDEAGSPPHFTDPRSPHFSQHGGKGGKGGRGGRGGRGGGRGFGGRGRGFGGR